MSALSDISEHSGLGLNPEGLARLEKIAVDGGVVSSYWVRRMLTEIRDLRTSIKKRNHCCECGKLNPVDNVCEDCYRELES